MEHVHAAVAAAQAWYAASPVVAGGVALVVAGLALAQAYLLVVAARYRHIPGPPSYPLVGHIPYLVSEPWARFAAFAQRYGSLYKLMVWDKLFVVVSDPELVKQIFVTRRHLYPKDSWSYKFFMCVGRGGGEEGWGVGGRRSLGEQHQHVDGPAARTLRSSDAPAHRARAAVPPTHPFTPATPPQGHPGPRRGDERGARVEGQTAAAEPRL